MTESYLERRNVHSSHDFRKKKDNTWKWILLGIIIAVILIGVLIK